MMRRSVSFVVIDEGVESVISLTPFLTQILGIIPLGTSMDYESSRSRELGCWHSVGPLGDLITGEFGTVNNEPKPDFAPSRDFANFLIDQGFGQDCPPDMKEFWVAELQKNYKGDEGRKRIRMAAINLRDRDGLHMRVADVVCPVLWLHVRFFPLLVHLLFQWRRILGAGSSILEESRPSLRQHIYTNNTHRERAM